MPGSIRPDAGRCREASRSAARRSSALFAAVLTLGGAAVAAEPAQSRGAAMLDALRDRDPAAHWEATGAALPPATLPPTTESPVDPVFSSPQADAVAPNWPADPSPTLPAARSAPAAMRFAQRDPAYESTPRSSIEPLIEEDAEIQSAARTPDELRKISEILPYFDYEPDPNLADPCLYLCPRPDGLPCKEYGPDELVPPCPEEIGLGNAPFVPPSMPPSVFAWKASNVSHNPLYFEDPQLERYGHTYGDLVQPFVSLGRFGVQVVGLPYQMALDPPHKEVYPLGYYRPGEPAPKLHYRIPFNARAAALSAVFYTGVGVVLP